jgi:hypothetical protein
MREAKRWEVLLTDGSMGTPRRGGKQVRREGER